MKKKYKLTWFSRFLIFSLFFVPISFGAISFIQGDDPIESLKDKALNFKIFDSTESIDSDSKSSSKPGAAYAFPTKSESTEAIQLLQERVEELETELLIKNTEIKTLKKILEYQKAPEASTTGS